MSSEYPVKFSLVIAAYNHEKFIAEALESILLQKVDFDYDIIVGEDGSSDHTAEIIESYALKYPQKIKLLKADSNVGLFKNAMGMFRACTGEYMAFMDGDDRWTHPDKLQKQVDFLDANKDYAGCFHDARIVQYDTDEHTGLERYSAYHYYSQFNHYRPDLHPWDLIERTIMPTCSLVFRRCDLVQQLERYREVNASLDWIAQLMIIKNSKFRYFNETWSVYNNNRGGMTKKVTTESFVHNNIHALRKLLTDDYYRNLKHHIYRSLATEMVNLFFLTESKKSMNGRWKILLRYLLHQQQYMFYRVKNLLEQL